MIELNDNLARLVRQAPTLQDAYDWWAKIIAAHGRAGEAWLGRNDRFYLLTILLGRMDAFDKWLYERSREVEESPDGHLDLWARR